MKKHEAQPKVKTIRASQDEIISAARKAASVPELDYWELREELVPKLGIPFPQFDSLVKRYRKDLQAQRKMEVPLNVVEEKARHAAALPRLEYDMYRERVCPELGVKFATFDREVERLRKEIRVLNGERISLTDAGNGTRFVNRNSDVVRSCRQLSKSGWFFWDEQRWVPDAVGDVMELARLTVADIAIHAAEDYKDQKIDGEQYALEIAWSQQSLSDSSLKAMLNQAGMGTILCVTGDKFDAHAELLNLQNGTYNLTTEEFYPARREDMLTQIANMNYDPQATCPKWEKFLSEALDGDMPMVEYVKRSTGYMLTGTLSEQCFFLIKGDAGTGKSTFWRVIRFALGEYFQMVPAGLFVQPSRYKKPSGEEATPGLVKLVGKRIAAEVELGENDAFNSSLLKRLTGGEALTARALYQGFITFQPQCTPVFLTNHTPGTDDFSGGLQDRLRIIEFNVKFRGTARENKHLVRELTEEASGILNWALAGLRDYRERGCLGEPAVVKDNVVKYFSNENAVARFLKEKALPHAIQGMVPEHVKGRLASFAQMYANFRDWAKSSQEECGSAKWFVNRMKQLGHATVLDRVNAKYYQFELVFPEQVARAA